MHKLNEEAYSNPEQWQRRATAAMTAHRAELPDPNERVSGTVADCSIHVTGDMLSGTITIFILSILISVLQLFVALYPALEQNRNKETQAEISWSFE